MGEMIERVAISLFEQWEKKVQRMKGYPSSPWEVQTDEFKETWRGYARRAITAMREKPTPEIVAVMKRYEEGDLSLKKAWQLMMNAALK